ACVVDRDPLRNDFSCFAFEKTQRLIERHGGRNDALNSDGIQLLELSQVARLGCRFQTRERRERYQAVMRTADIDLLELTRRQPVGRIDLRNDLLAAPLDAETVDVIGT